MAKNVIQISVLSPSNRELRNSALTRHKFAAFLARQHPALVAFEACATSHYWARVAQRHGHQVKIIPAKAVAPFRQGHKTDENDALAVAEAARRPNIKLAPLKTIEQQGLQAIQRSRELLLHQRFNNCLSVLTPRYDHIIIDSPPILAATDAAIIGQMAGATLMVIKSGEHPMREIDQSVKRLKRAGVNLRGFVLNDILRNKRYGVGKYAYQYTYGSP